MTPDTMQSGDLALIRAVRGLDQGAGGKDQMPEKLAEIRRLLSHSSADTYHAAEEMLLRWLLKHMNGAGADAEAVRRYPVTWSVLGAVFPRITPLSLAKALADRRFIAILQQTLKEISAPQASTKVAVAAAAEESPAKRRRLELASFELDAQREHAGCLRSAESVFEALDSLLQQCHSVPVTQTATSSSSSGLQIGTEHLKSLFYTANSKEMVEIVTSLLNTCHLALDSASLYEGQASWISTFTTIWDLHLRSDEKSLEAVTFLAKPGATMLGRLTGTWGKEAAWRDDDNDEAVILRQKWTSDLRAFLTRKLVLRSRAAFLNTRDISKTQHAIMLSSGTAAPVLFELVVKAPAVVGGGLAARQDTDAWIQAVFDVVEDTVRSVPSARRNRIMTTILATAAEHRVPLSLGSLHLVCKEYALADEKADWGLLLRLVKLNPDVFLVSDEGKAMLEDVLGHIRTAGALGGKEKKTEKEKEGKQGEDDTWTKSAEFVVALAEGYAATRNLPGFLKLWLANLAHADSLHLSADSPRNAWSQRALVAAVAKTLQDSMNTNQILDSLDWLAAQSGGGGGSGSSAEKKKKKEAAMLVLEAIARGISDEDVVDAVRAKLFAVAFSSPISSSGTPLLTETASCRARAARWAVAQMQFSWAATRRECADIWLRVRPELVDVLKTRPVCRDDTFAAFKCAAAAWVASYPDGEYVEEIADATCLFLQRLRDEPAEAGEGEDASVPTGAYLSWIILGPSRLLSLVEKRGLKFAEFLLNRTPLVADARTLSENEAIHAILDNETNINNPELMENLISRAIGQIERGSWSSPSVEAATTFLLRIPMEVISSEQRDGIAASLFRQQASAQEVDVDCWKRNVSLLVRLMEKPTFYEGMSFKDMDLLALSIPLEACDNDTNGKGSFMKTQECMRLLEALAILILRRMVSNVKKRDDYLVGAVSLVKDEWKLGQSKPNSRTILRIPLLKALAATLPDDPKNRHLDPSSLRKELLRVAKGYAAASCAEWNEASPSFRKNSALLGLLTALDALNSLEERLVADGIRPFVADVVAISDDLLRQGLNAGLEIRLFLARYFYDDLKSPLDLRHAATQVDVKAKPGLSRINKYTVFEYVDAVMAKMGEESNKLRHLEKLLSLEAKEEGGSLCQHLVNYRIIRHIKDTPSTTGGENEAERIKIDSGSEFDLATAHSKLCHRLAALQQQDTKTGTDTDSDATHRGNEIVLIAQTIHMLLEQKAQAMVQGNIEITLSKVAVVASSPSSASSSSLSPRTFYWLCRLVDAVLKRHRRRLSGRYHLLVAVLQALLTCLLTHPSLCAAVAANDNNANTSASCAQQYARLLTLVCEPSEAAVSSFSSSSSSRTGGVDQQNSAGHGPGSLASERDRARRYAGQYMYAVVMRYAQLLVERPVPRPVREALEPGVNSVLGVTTGAGLRIMGDAMDASGRAVVKELYRRYQRFGKWTGV